MSSTTWNELEVLLGYDNLRSGEYLRDYWDTACVVVRRKLGEKYTGAGHELIDDEMRLRNVINETYTDCCRVDDNNIWSSVDLETTSAEEKWRLHKEEGWTLRLAIGHEVTPSIHNHLFQLQKLFGGHPVGSNVYVTPANERGFSRHCDAQNIFVTQLIGSKRWTITLHELNCVDQDLEDLPLINDEMISEIPKEFSGCFTSGSVILYPGDRLYLPRGFAHSCKTKSNIPSVHLTVDVSYGCSLGALYNLLLESLSLPIRRSCDFTDNDKLSLPLRWIYKGGTVYCGILNNQLTDIAISDQSVTALHSESLISKLAEQIIELHSERFFASSVPRPVGDNSPSLYKLCVTTEGSVEIITFPDKNISISDPNRSPQVIPIPNCLKCLQLFINESRAKDILDKCNHSNEKCLEYQQQINNTILTYGIVAGKCCPGYESHYDLQSIKRRKDDDTF